MRTNRSSLSAIVFAAAIAAGVVACAQGAEGTGNGDDDVVVDAKAIDAPNNTIDARPIDARVIDAPLSIDAPALPDGGFGLDGIGGTCSTHAQCGSGMCCNSVLMMCQVGDPLPLPPPLDCFLPA